MDIKNLPELHPAELEHTQKLADILQQEIESNGPISFEQYMAHALYHPEYGYYTSGRLKLASHRSSQAAIKAATQEHLNKDEDIPSDGNEPAIGLVRGEELDESAMQSAATVSGDFITAPELSPWFGHTLAVAIAEVLSHCEEKNILEFGAGSGILAKQILDSLKDKNIKYFILELSSDLKNLQQQTLSAYKDRVVWLEQLPESFIGCVVANEVLDAMPVRLYSRDEDCKLKERYVDIKPNSEPNSLSRFIWFEQDVKTQDTPDDIDRLLKISGYTSEFNEQAKAWITSMGSWLKQGAAILIDYGFPASEYYHPQRGQGTLMCHFRHHAHSEVLALPGIQDITAHVNFSAIAEKAVEADLEVIGYTSQANFLMNCGLLDLLSALDPEDVESYALNIGPVQKLLSEAEMGELFKVIMLAKNVDELYPIGFTRADRRFQL
ncbi:MAG: SAM-dependent methyltransferase [Alcaligenaceae bacterium]|nr:SAM-dependent methyltransferase [Alcaligenaceae bacterium]HZJ97931.1 SAM-dependent methyltransferase [Oligella sp.]